MLRIDTEVFYDCVDWETELLECKDTSSTFRHTVRQNHHILSLGTLLCAHVSHFRNCRDDKKG